MYQTSKGRSAPAHHSASPPEQLSGPATKAILYLEDNEDDSVLLRHALRAAGLSCRLDVIGTPAAAKSFLNERAPKAPDLIICDLGLAGTCGLELLAWVRQQPHLSKVPILLVTGSLSPAQRARAAELQIDDCIEKSVDWRELTRHIQRLL
jgi:CheY-like chemotaxis protein